MRALIVSLNSTLFYTLKVYITYVLVIFYKFNNRFVEIGLKEFRKLTEIHRFLSVEVDFPDKNSGFNADNLLFNILSVLKNT